MLLNMIMFKDTICDFGKMNINMTDKQKKKEATFAVPYNGEDNNDYVDGKVFCCNSSSYITNLEGEVVQHIEYVPLYETLLQTPQIGRFHNW